MASVTSLSASNWHIVIKWKELIYWLSVLLFIISLILTIGQA